MRVLLIFIYLFQNDPIADLKTQFITANDTTKVLLLSDLCYQYRFINQDSAIHFGEQGIALAKKINFNRGLALCLSDLGVVYLDQSNFKKARELWTQSLTIREKTNDLQGVGSIYMKIGVIEFQTGNLDSAAQNFLSALVIFEKINDPEGIPSALNNVAASYQHQNRLDKALEYFTRSYEFAASKNKIQDVGVAGLNIANIYYLQNDLDKAIPGVKHAIGRLEGNVNATGFLASALNNLSEYYLQKEYFDSARTVIEKALTIRQEKKDSVGIISSLNNLANVEIHFKEYEKAEKNLTIALTIALKKDLKIELKKIYGTLSSLYTANDKFELALETYKKFHTIDDILRNNEQARQITDINVKYETEKKDNQISQLNKDNEIKTATIERNYLFFGGLAVTLSFAFLFWRYRDTLKQKAIAQEQKLHLREVQINAVIDSQERERKRFASDLHDGMGQLVSALQFNIQSIKQSNDLSKTIAQVENSEQLLNEIQNEIRNIAFNLMPPVLVKEGLVPAVRELIRRLNKTGSLKAELTAHDVPSRFSQVAEISVYRIIQELLSNIIKYSKATEIVVSFTGYEEEVVLTIEDSGDGYDLNTFQNSERSNGWNTIQTRMNLIHGQIEFDTVKGRKNNTIIIHIPLHTNRETVQIPALQNT